MGIATIADYEAFIYGLCDAFPTIIASTLVVVRTGPSSGRVVGQLTFASDIKHHRIPVAELSFADPNLPTLIQEIETTLL